MSRRLLVGFGDGLDWSGLFLFIDCWGQYCDGIYSCLLLVGWTGRTIIICVVMTCKGVLSHFSFFVWRLLIKWKNMAFEAIESIKWLLSFRVSWWLIQGMLLPACSSMENEPKGNLTLFVLRPRLPQESKLSWILELGEGFHPLTRVSKGSTNRRIGIQIA